MENNLPKGWISSPLKDVVSSRKGKKPTAVISHEKKGYDPYILIDELEGKPARSFTNDPKVPRVRKEDVLLVWDGSIGKCTSGMTGAVGSTMAVLSPKNLQISLPTLGEQEEIVKRLKSSFAFIEKNENEFNKAKGYTDKLGQSILAKASRGELVR